MNEETGSAAETTNEAIAAPAAEAPAEAAPAESSAPAASSMLSSAETPAETAQPASEEAPAAVAAEEAKEPEGAPETYAEFTAPEGVVLDKTMVSELCGAAKELNLSQSQVQSVIDRVAPAMAKREMERITEVSNAWAERSKGNKEIMDGMPGIARIRDMFMNGEDGKPDPEIQEFLNSPIGNHPGCLKFLARIGRQFEEAGFPQGSASRGGTRFTADDVYKNSMKY